MKREARNITKEEFASQASSSMQKIFEEEYTAPSLNDSVDEAEEYADEKPAKKSNKPKFKERFSAFLAKRSADDEESYSDNDYYDEIQEADDDDDMDFGDAMLVRSLPEAKDSDSQEEDFPSFSDFDTDSESDAEADSDYDTDPDSPADYSGDSDYDADSELNSDDDSDMDLPEESPKHSFKLPKIKFSIGGKAETKTVPRSRIGEENARKHRSSKKKDDEPMPEDMRPLPKMSPQEMASTIFAQLKKSLPVKKSAKKKELPQKTYGKSARDLILAAIQKDEENQPEAEYDEELYDEDGYADEFYDEETDEEFYDESDYEDEFYDETYDEDQINIDDLFSESEFADPEDADYEKAESDEDYDDYDEYDEEVSEEPLPIIPADYRPQSPFKSDRSRIAEKASRSSSDIQQEKDENVEIIDTAFIDQALSSDYEDDSYEDEAVSESGNEDDFYDDAEYDEAGYDDYDDSYYDDYDDSYYDDSDYDDNYVPEKRTSKSGRSSSRSGKKSRKAKKKNYRAAFAAILLAIVSAISGALSKLSDKKGKKRPQAASKKKKETPVKKNKGKKRREAEFISSIWSVLIFCVFALIIAVMLLVVPRSTTSEIERRSLATMPEFSFGNYFNGEFTSGIATYYDDTVPARDSLKNISNTIKNLFGFTTKDTVEVIGNVAKVNTPDIQPETAAETETLPAAETPAEDETTTAEEPVKEDKVNSKDYRAANADATMEDGILVVYQDNHYRALSLFGGVYETLYADTANYIRAMTSYDINMYFMPIPLAAAFYLPANYSDYSADQKSEFDDLYYNYMDQSITYVPVIDALNNHNGEDIYLRTDHHWAPLGAYYAAKEFAKASNVPFADISEYDAHEEPGYVGTMYAYTGSANILYDPDDFIWYSARNKYIVDYYDREFNYYYTGSLFFDQPLSGIYCTFLGTDDQIAKVNTDVKNGRILLLVKDSFANAMVPFLTHSFEKIYVVDQRYFELNLLYFINTCGITDILLAHDSYSLVGAEAELLEDICFNYLDKYFYDEAPEPNLTGEVVVPDHSDDHYTPDWNEVYGMNDDEYYDDSDYNEDSYEEDYYDDSDYYEESYDDGYYEESYDDGYYEEDYWEDEY